MVIDAIGGAIRAPVASHQGVVASRSPQFWQRVDRKVTKMEYLIVLGVALMIALYAVIVQRCLHEA